MTTTLYSFFILFVMSSAMAQEESGSGDASDDGLDVYTIAAIFFMVVLALLLLFRFASQLVSCDVLLEETASEAKDTRLEIKNETQIELTSANKRTIP